MYHPLTLTYILTSYYSIYRFARFFLNIASRGLTASLPSATTGPRTHAHTIDIRALLGNDSANERAAERHTGHLPSTDHQQDKLVSSDAALSNAYMQSQ
jgi:hypothetical protein